MVSSAHDGDRSNITHDDMPSYTEEEGDWSSIVAGPVLMEATLLLSDLTGRIVASYFDFVSSEPIKHVSRIE